MAAPLSGQTLNDRILAARHSLAGQGLAKAVCKATTEELVAPKRKHLDYLLQCTEEPNVSIPSLANLLIDRAQSPNWVVVFKSLVTIHHLMCYGNERFVQYLASSNTSFQLSSFLDKSGAQGYDMSPFVRRYAKYLTEKSVSYRTVAFDFCKVKRGKDGGTLRQMSAEKLLKTLPVLQTQLDSLLDFECGTSDLTNAVINAAFILLFRDLIRLYACYNDGIINLIDKYFDMNKKLAREALDSYKKFLIRMDRVTEFLKVAEKIGVDRGDIPDLAKAPSSLLEALEAHLANLEGRKVGSPSATTPTSSGQINEKEKQRILAEEEEAMQKYKEQQKASNPFFASASGSTEPDNTPNILDLFGLPEPAKTSEPTTAGPAAASASGKSGADDLLMLSGNPFANVMNTNAAAQPGGAVAAPSVFDSSSGPGADFFSDILQPQGSAVASGTSFGAGGPFGAPAGTNGSAANGGKPALVSGDLDASIANLTSNLNLAGGAGKRNAAVTQPRGPPMGANLSLTPFSSSLQQPLQQQQPVGINWGNNPF